MTISRRSFARSIIAAVAGATVLRQAVAAPVVTECHKHTVEEIANTFGVPAGLVPEGPRPIMEKGCAFDHGAFDEWRSYSLQPRRLSVSMSVSRELLEDSPLSVSTIVQSRLALALAKAVYDQWCEGAEYTVSMICNDDLANPWLTYTHIATEDKDYRMQRLRDEWCRMHVGPRNVSTLPDGWSMGQYVSYQAADDQPAVDPREWPSFARGRFDFSLDDQKTPR
jgi:hypothetical protein